MFFIEINFCDCCLQHSGLLLHGKASWEETTLQHFLPSLSYVRITSLYVVDHCNPLPALHTALENLFTCKFLSWM